MFRQIVVAYDGSEHAKDALALALRLRDPDGGHLILACATSEAPWWRPEHGHREPAEVPEEVALMLAAARAQVPAGIRVALRAPGAGSPARALTELAERDHADLVVIGSSRRKADGRISLERTAGRLLQGAPCAVVVAPAGLRATGPFHHVGVAYDGSHEARAALRAGYAIAAVHGAAVTLFHALVVMPGDDEDTRLRAALRAQRMLDEAADDAPAGVNPRTLVLHGSAGQEIAEACDGIVDLLVCGSRGYGPIQRALLGSVAETLMERAPHPVLVIPRQAADAAPEPDAEPAAMGAER